MKLMDQLQAAQRIEASRENRLQASAPSRKGSASFESFLTAERSANGTARQSNSNDEGSRSVNRLSSNSDDNVAQSGQNESVGVNRPQVENSGESAGQNPEIAGVNTESDENLGIPMDEGFVSELAALFGLCPLELMNALANLGVDLTEGLLPEDMSKLAQAVLGASSSVELLWYPEGLETIEQINTLVKDWTLAKGTEAVENLVSEGTKGLEISVGTEAAVSGELLEDQSEEQLALAPKDTEADASGEKAANTSANSGGRPESTGNAAGQQAVSDESVPAERSGQMVENNIEARVEVQPMADLNNPVSESQLAEVRETLFQSRPSADTIEVVKQLVEQMKVQVSPDTTELRLTLKPETLGEVMLRVITQNGIVSAQFYAETQRIKEIIEANLNQMRSALAEKGIEVAELSAFVAQEQSEHEAMSSFERERTLSAARINRVMNRNGMTGEEGAIEEESAVETVRNPLEVDYEA